MTLHTAGGSPKPEGSIFRTAKRLAAIPRSREQTYFWISQREALFLRHVPKTQHYQAFKLNVTTGRQTALVQFNAKHAASITSTPMQMVYSVGEGSEPKPQEVIYLPPSSALSPNGKTLVWQSGYLNWAAARLDGQTVAKWKGSSTGSHRPFWLHDGVHWVEPISKYVDGAWQVPSLIIRNAGNPADHRTVTLTNGKDCIWLGISKDNELVGASYKYGHAGVPVTMHVIPTSGMSARVRDY
jgi:hypothetical protein